MKVSLSLSHSCPPDTRAPFPEATSVTTCKKIHIVLYPVMANLAHYSALSFYDLTTDFRDSSIKSTQFFLTPEQYDIQNITQLFGVDTDQRVHNPFSCRVPGLAPALRLRRVFSAWMCPQVLNPSSSAGA